MATVKNAKTTNKKRKEMWTDVKGNAYIFGKAFPKGNKKNDYRIVFSTSLYAKDENEDAHNFYFGVRFANCDAPDRAGKYHINILKGFLALDVWETGERPCVVVLDYEILEEPDEDEEF